MRLGKNKLYLLLTIGCLAGYIWLFTIHTLNAGIPRAAVSVCLIKNVTSIPCPSCGATRSVLALLHGDLLASLYWNPVGVLLLALLVAAPVWVAYDGICQKETLLKAYHQVESTLQRKQVAIPASLLVLGNWIWNIYKGL
jgi:hypothetical protein